jgi:hypothetical protein
LSGGLTRRQLSGKGIETLYQPRRVECLAGMRREVYRGCSKGY